VLLDGAAMEGVDPQDRAARLFMSHSAYQCGYCSPGFILTMKALFGENTQPADAELREALGGNLCRGGSYLKILEAWRASAG
jgi:aerobic carbon-monoxide dehydrogenase small subunit